MKNFFDINTDLFQIFIKDNLLLIKNENEKDCDFSIKVKTELIKNYMLNDDFLFLYIYYKEKENNISFRITYSMDGSILKDVFFTKPVDFYIRNISITTVNKRPELIKNKVKIEQNIEKFIKNQIK